MPTSAQDADILAALAAWEAAHDEWERRNEALGQAMRAGASGEELSALMRETLLLQEAAKRLFDQYLDACGGRIDSSPGPLDG